MHYRDNLTLVRQFGQGFRVRYLDNDTLTVSKSNLPPSTEILVLKPKGARDYE